MGNAVYTSDYYDESYLRVQRKKGFDRPGKEKEYAFWP
jgi:hypothetical protein